MGTLVQPIFGELRQLTASHAEAAVAATGSHPRKELVMAKPTAVVVGVGAERGLGAALCRRFAAEGPHVIVAGRTAPKIQQVVQTIVGLGGTAEAVATDATLEADVARLFD